MNVCIYNPSTKFRNPFHIVSFVWRETSRKLGFLVPPLQKRMIRAMRLFSRSRMRMLAVGGVGRGRHGSTVVNLNNRRWSSSSSSIPPHSSESMKEPYNGMNSSTTTDDAIDFVMEVKHVFQDEPEKLDEFYRVLFDFRADRIDLSVVKEVMMELLEGHNNLIWKFNNILPPGEIPLPLNDDGLPFKYDQSAFRDDWE